MTSHQTVVVELGSSRIKVGFAGESKPRRVLNNSESDGGGGWRVDVNDSLVSGACNWTAFFRYLSSPEVTDTKGPVTSASTVYDWEKTLHPLFSHILTSILLIQRPYSRHRMLVLINDVFPPRHFREALHRVLLEYLGVGGVWLVNGGAFEALYYLLEGLPPSLHSLERPKAHMLVDIGTYEARVAVSVAGSSILQDTHQSTMAGYQSFLRQVLANYHELNEKLDESEQSGEVGPKSEVATLGDANAAVQAWVATSSLTPDSTFVSVKLPSLEQKQQPLQATAESAIQLPVQPLLQAFHQVYLDYTNPSSLLFAMLKCVMASPIDYRKAVMQNVLLLGGGSEALRNFGSEGSTEVKGKSALSLQLEMAGREACGISGDDIMEESENEEKKEESPSAVSPIARQRFQSLRRCAEVTLNDNGERMGGINIQYPDPFAADMAVWIGGSILGTLGFKNYERKI